MDKMQNKIKEVFGESVKFNEPMAPYTTFNTGGPADIFVVVRSEEEVQKILKIAFEYSKKIFILGGGSNILVGDKGFRGIVVKNEYKSIRRENESLIAASGVSIRDLLENTVKEGLTGLEFMAGIYGTVGGAISGNAGAYGHSIGELVDFVEVITNNTGKINLPVSKLSFSYRKFDVKDERIGGRNFFISSCKLRLADGDPKKIQHRIEAVLDERNGKMPDPIPSAGCFFKNAESKNEEFGKLSAGKLLDEIGAKEMGSEKVGVHSRHANILLNRGGASSSDILRFAEDLKNQIRDKYGFDLEFEVKLIGEF